MTSFSVMSLVFFGTLGFVAVSLAMWFFIRMQWRKVWLPTLRVIDLESTEIRKIKVQTPPWIPFLLFLLASLVFLFFTSKPKNLVSQESTPTNMRIHLFLDLSPSVAAHLTLPQYVQRVEQVWNDISSHSKITVSSSHSAWISSPKNFHEVQELIYALGFHRAGIHLGSAIKQQREKMGDIDGLVIFSDANTLSWQNFNWNFLAEDMKLFLVDLRSDKAISDNVFFRDIRLFSEPDYPTLEWDLEIERTSANLEARRGDVKLIHGGETLISVPWSLNKGVLKTLVRASVHAKKISQLSNVDTPLLWTLEAHEADALNLDNSFRMPLKGLRQDVLLVGEPFGERQLEDPFYQLSMALETFGFVPQRMDRWTSSLAKTSYPFVILAVDESQALEDTCPLAYASQLANARLQNSEQTFPVIWLMPKIVGSSLKNVCSCFQKLTDVKSNSPDLCAQAYNPMNFNEIMKATGAQALGAKISNTQSAFGWYKEDRELGMKVATYALPLMPSRKMGIDHAVFPLIVKELLQWQGLVDTKLAKKKFSDWPRIADLSQIPEWQDASLNAHDMESNVPLAASYLSSLGSEELPPLWITGQKLFNRDYRFQKDDYEPGFWIPLILSLLALFMFLELLWNWRGRLRHLVPFLILILAFIVLNPPLCMADLTVSVLGSRYDAELETILKEVPLRTSIELDSAIKYHQLEPKNLGEPWYWVRDSKFLVDKNGALKSEFRHWLKRGGFLIVQGMDLESLSRLTKEAFSTESPESGWLAIPPDHELMRSFYLIEALPSCRGQIWNGFVFDGRLAILAIPFDFLKALTDRSDSLGSCEQTLSSEFKVRLFINIAMAALATDYKRDQIHTREILKRLH